MNPLPDKELILQLQSGSVEALGLLYDRHQRLVYRTALGITGNSEAAADLLQDVFLRLFRYANNFDSDRPLEPWLYRMTTNLSYTWIKTSQRWLHPLEELVDRIASIGLRSPYDEIDRNEEREAVQNALFSLPLPQRVVVVMYYLNDLSLAEISEILEVPVGTVKSRLHYGRLALKKKLAASGDSALDFNYERS
jgi:RNA polymerase sigma-70 factor (ECF subfamily)